MSEETTAGFYRVNNEQLEFSPGNLYGPGWDLLVSEKDEYTYPMHEWYWFDTQEAAKEFFNI
jgi:hypothetical protein